jgi:hypothetical protein
MPANPASVAVLFPPILAAGVLLGRTIIRRPLLTVPTKTAYFYTRTEILATFGLLPLVTYINSRDFIDSSIFRYEHITPNPFQLWQSSEGFTLDDALLVGGIGGLIISYRTKSLQALSFGHLQLGRLGATCAWSAASLVPGDRVINWLTLFLS